jgi:transposase
MSCSTDHPDRDATATRPHDATILVSLELSRRAWLVTSLAPGSEKLSRHVLAAGDGSGLLAFLAELKAKAERQALGPVAIVTIQEAGLDGFWLHRLLENNGIVSHVVEPASIAVPRRHRRAKTDVIDGETLIRVLAAWRRGEPRVCAMVKPPSPEEEDRRRLSRERDRLLQERIRHTNRIRGLLFGQGIGDFDPLRKDRRERLDALVTGDGRPLPATLKAELLREITRLELVVAQLAEVEQARDRLVEVLADGAAQPAAALLGLKGIGPAIAVRLWLEGLFRPFENRRQVAAYAGLAPSPWQSGGMDREQGIAKSGNPRLRHTMVELAWLWLRHQPDSALSTWFRNRVGDARGRVRRVAIVALARKLLVALWRHAVHGVVPEGAVLKA